jgi:hypothetical protein
MAGKGAKHLRAFRLRWLAMAAAGLLACRGPSPSGPALRPHERALVDVYVRISQIEALRADEPDSVNPALDRLAASYDSVAVGRALAELEADPTRWQFVFDAISQRLHELEESPAGGGLPRVQPPPELSAPGPARNPSKPRIP